MKLKNILSILFFLVVAASCSMESDTVMNDISNEINKETSDNQAYVSFKLDQKMQTKSSSSVQGEDTTIADTEIIQNVIYFLLEEDKIVGVTTAGSADYQGKTILTKVAEGSSRTLNVMAIANVSEPTKAALLACNTKANINDVILGSADLSMLVKSGEGSVTITKGTTMTPEKYKQVNGSLEGYPTTSVTITVTQRTARIEIKSLSCFIPEGQTQYTVSLESISLENQNIQGLVSGVAAGLVKPTTAPSETFPASSAVSAANGKCFYTFANNATDKTTLALHFKVNEKKQTKLITIKHSDQVEKVLSDFVYRLTINAKVESGEVTCEVGCTVLDWVRYNIDLGDISNN